MTMEPENRQLDHLQSTKMTKWSICAASFYRIIMPSVVKKRRLVLPREFVEQYSDELSNVVRLIVPISGNWNIGLAKAGNVLCLHDGWQKFMEHHSIRFGYFLIFKYKGNSDFDVHIFDLTATEIQYPFCSNSRPCSPINWSMQPKKEESSEDEDDDNGEEEDDDDDDNSFEIADSIVSGSKFTFSNYNVLTRNSNQVLQQRRSNGNLACRDLFHAFNKCADGIEPTSSNDFRRKTSSRRKKSSSSKIQSKRKPASLADTKRALDAARTFKSANPSYTVVLKDYNLHRNIIAVPLEFARKYMCDCQGFIDLQDSDNKKWRVRCIKRPGKAISLSKGWAEFVRDKGLHIGDVCIFELIKSGAVLKVSIFHASEDPVPAN